MPKKWIAALCMMVCLIAPLTGFAQEDAPVTDGVLSFDLPPVIVEIPAGETRTYTYTLSDAQIVQLQAFGETAQPTLTIRRGETVIASDLNAAGAFTVRLQTALDAGDYIVEVGTTNNTSGQVILIVIAQQPILSQSLLPDVPVSAGLDDSNPLARYVANTPPDAAAQLLIEAIGEGAGLVVTVSDHATGDTVASFRAPLYRAIFALPVQAATYTIDVGRAAEGEQTYAVCLEIALSGACEARDSTSADLAIPTVVPLTTPLVPTPTAPAACTVTPNAPSVNVRQSASTNAPIVGALSTGMSGVVVGISPDGAWYRIEVGALSGWVSLSVVAVVGNCANVPVVQPPPFAAPPATVAPPSPAPPPATAVQPPTPSGPCLIRITGELLIYTVPNADPSNIQDEMQPGYELIPIGRLADNSWWQTNYANSWIETRFFGDRAQVSGDCRALPIVMS